MHSISFYMIRDLAESLIVDPKVTPMVDCQLFFRSFMWSLTSDNVEQLLWNHRPVRLRLTCGTCRGPLGIDKTVSTMGWRASRGRWVVNFITLRSVYCLIRCIRMTYCRSKMTDFPACSRETTAAGTFRYSLSCERDRAFGGQGLLGTWWYMLRDAVFRRLFTWLVTYLKKCFSGYPNALRFVPTLIHYNWSFELACRPPKRKDGVN